MPIRLLFAVGILLISPPWLRRRIGGAIMRSLGVPIDTETDRNVDGVELRFPNALQPDALGFLGRERRILRGPGEDAATFAGRLRTWWDAHRARGGPYELLRQLRAFFLPTLSIDFTVVGNSGIRHVIDTAGVITRDIVAWNGDGNYPTKWARIWLLFPLDDATFPIPLVTESGEPILTEGGEAIIVTIAIDALTPSDIELICAVPREWSAAHIDEIHIILLPPGGELWGFTADGDPVGTWADDDPTPGQIWGGADEPVDILCT